MMMLWRKQQIYIDLLKSQTKQDLRLQYVKLLHCVSTSYSGYTVFPFIKRLCANSFSSTFCMICSVPTNCCLLKSCTQTQRKSETIGKFGQCILCFLKLLSEIFRACLSPVTEEFSFRKTLTRLTTNLKDIPLWPLTHLNDFARGGYGNSSISVARESFTLLDTIVSIEDTLTNPFSAST